MHTFSTRILTIIQTAWLSFPGLDDQAILDRVIPVAEEYTLTRILTHHLSTDDQALFRDAYLSAPDVFDPIEFLSDTLPDLDTLIERYFRAWLQDFQKTL